MTPVTDRLCPFDKKPCIGGRCMAWDGDREQCGFCPSHSPVQHKPVPPDLAEEKQKRKRQSGGSDSHSRFKVELFD